MGSLVAGSQVSALSLSPSFPDLTPSLPFWFIGFFQWYRLSADKKS
jgi:hypothetical protein